MKTEEFLLTRAAELPFGSREADWIGCSGFPRSAVGSNVVSAFREVPEGGRTRSLIA
jgi:hypothetical protein